VILETAETSRDHKKIVKIIKTNDIYSDTNKITKEKYLSSKKS